MIKVRAELEGGGKRPSTGNYTLSNRSRRGPSKQGISAAQKTGGTAESKNGGECGIHTLKDLPT